MNKKKIKATEPWGVKVKIEMKLKKLLIIINIILI